MHKSYERGEKSFPKVELRRGITVKKGEDTSCTGQGSLEKEDRRCVCGVHACTQLNLEQCGGSGHQPSM